MAHYNQHSFTSALEEAGIRQGNIVFSHSNVGFFGIPEGSQTKEHMFHTILNSFLDVLGDTGTLIVPTFTYSFPKGNIFDPDQTASDCGLFTEMLRTHPNAIRSEDPCISVAAIGKHAKELVSDIGTNAYGDESFFHRFHQAQGTICNMNFDAASTLLHYAERKLQVPYRFDKTFTGIVRKSGQEEARESTIFVRYQSSDETVSAFEAFDALAREKHLCKTVPIGRGSINVISAHDSFKLVEETLPQRPWFLTRAEVTGVEPILIPEESA